MKEIHFTFDIKLTPRIVRGVVTVAMFLSAVPELDSENVTLATYYPAPSGVYTNMITTGNTFLARDTDGAAVVIGPVPGSGAYPNRITTTPNGETSANKSLEILGRMGVNDYYRMFGGASAMDQGVFHIRTGDNGDEAIVFEQVSGDTVFERMRIGGNGFVGIATSNPQTQLDVAGTVYIHGAGCTEKTYSFVGNTSCAPGQYATYTPGVFAPWQFGPSAAAGSAYNGYMFCCNRP